MRTPSIISIPLFAITPDIIIYIHNVLILIYILWLILIFTINTEYCTGVRSIFPFPKLRRATVPCTVMYYSSRRLVLYRYSTVYVVQKKHKTSFIMSYCWHLISCHSRQCMVAIIRSIYFYFCLWCYFRNSRLS